MDVNPAARLHALMVSLKSPKQGAIASDSLREVLGVHGQGQAELLRALAAFCLLPADVEREIRARQDLDIDLFMEWKPPVMHVMAGLLTSAGQHTENLMAVIDASTLVHLRHAAHALGRGSVDLDDENVATLADMLSDLEDEIAGDDAMDDDLREFLLELVHRMQQAVRLVGVQGREGLRDAYRYTVGALRLSPWTDDDLPAGGGADDVGVKGKFLAVMGLLDNIVSISAGAYALGAPTVGLLLGIGG